MITYGSVCSGIEAAHVAWAELGWEQAWSSEIEPFPCKVLQHYYPEIPNLGDMNHVKEKAEFTARPIDLLVGGTPCQSFSIAGLRKGLDDPRGNLALVFLGLVERARPRWVVWENVPGVLSSVSDDGPRPMPPPDPVDLGREGQELEIEDEYDAEATADFECFVAGLRELGYGVAYRVFDAQFFGVPQRRRRVFVVASPGGWQRPGAVLFDAKSLSGDPPPGRQAGEGFAADVVPSLTASGRGVSRTGETRGQDPVIAEVAHALNAGGGRGLGRLDASAETFIAHTLRGAGFDASEDGTGRGTPLIAEAIPIERGNQGAGDNVGFGKPGDPSYTLQARQAHAVLPPPVMFKIRGGVEVDSAGKSAGKGFLGSEDLAFTLATMQDQWLGQASRVRRLTPRECERLQGFPDDYTAIPGAKDGPRYKALGNSMAVPVMKWIGQRIQMVEDLGL